MKSTRVTSGQLADFLTELGFTSKVMDEHRVVFYDKASESLFVLPNRSPDSPAREKDLRHVRYQLHWRGVLDEADFDAHFANLSAVTA